MERHRPGRIRGVEGAENGAPNGEGRGRPAQRVLPAGAAAVPRGAKNRGTRRRAGSGARGSYLKAAEPAAVLEVLAPPLLLPAAGEATREAAATWSKADSKYSK